MLDTLARCAIGLEENSSKEMGLFAEAMRLVSVQTGAHVMVVHHNNKSGEYRGSSALTAAVDTHISLERGDNGDYVTLKFEKQKDDEELPPMVFTKHLVELGNDESSLVFRRNDEARGGRFDISPTELKVLKELVSAFGETGATASQWGSICESAGVSKRSFLYAKQKLLKLQMVSCPDTGKRGAIHTPNFEKCDFLLEGARVQNGAECTKCTNQQERRTDAKPANCFCTFRAGKRPCTYLHFCTE